LQNGRSNEGAIRYGHLAGYSIEVAKCENRERRSGNRKGCDIGYAPASNSCEGANSVDTRTVAALDVITAFAVPNPNCPSQDQSVFSGLGAL